jgi:hypothetical protein
MFTSKAVAALYRLGADFGLVYEFQPDGVLIGYWTIVGGVGGEVLTPRGPPAWRSARPRRCTVSNPSERLGLTDHRAPLIEARDEGVGRL